MRSLVIAAVAGLGSISTAHSVTLHFDLDGDPFTSRLFVPSTEDHWTVYASFTGFPDTGAYFGGFVGDWIGNGSGVATDLVNMMAGQGTTFTANGSSINNLNIFNNALLGTNVSGSPLPIFTFTTIQVSDTVEYRASGVASVFPDDGLFTLPVQFTDVNVISDILWIPTPGSVAALGLGVMLTVRRRR